ncbi:FtsW/RodA/SpoVE family cell cycle protein [Roseomonas vinacea]|uniref:Probable peptidoglycan glycosyltransferase FtsW n=1 Tax=Muricoccus vinaceus TaxID=424704 RepID=A0ABV6IQ38_9PROT
MALSRADTSTLGRWWWSVDRWTLAALLTLVGFGYLMVLAAAPAVAERIGASSRNLFFAKQVFFLIGATTVMGVVSLLSPKGVRRLAMLGFLGAMVLTVATLVIGAEVKGARRWLNLPLVGSLQPSEFLKPCFAVVAAWLIAEAKTAGRKGWGAWGTVLGLYAMVALVLQRQPDIGMLLVVTFVFFTQVFVAGINMAVVTALGGLGVGGLFGAYFLFHHVRSRIDRFLYPEHGNNYQVDVALEAFGAGGMMGVGPGEGRMKTVLPDAHADFVFAVVGEEFGLLVCLLILGLFAFVVVRGMMRLLAETDLYVILAASGLLAQFGLQAFINMASSLHLIPTKGMTLPFVSYGGSSVIAIALGMGFLLALTRKRMSRAEEGAG